MMENRRNGIIPSMNKNTVFFCVFSVLLFVALLNLFVLTPLELDKQDYMLDHAALIEQYTPGYKDILLWTTWFGNKYWHYHAGSREFTICPERRCYITANKQRSLRASMLLFHLRDLGSVEDLPLDHPTDQRWMFITGESPVNSHTSQGDYNFRAFDGMFNMSLTYMPDSDIYGPYNRYQKLETYNSTTIHSSNESNNITQRSSSSVGRTEMVLWYVSNCITADTKWRDDYVRQLQKHVSVTKYGECGTYDPCNRSPDEETKALCVKNTRKRFKFYLAFENSLCRWYITEKFWNAFRDGLVPVVLGAPLEDVVFIAPPNSFLHVDNFTSPEHLAEYLHYLGANPQAYNRYHEWREQYQIGDTSLEHNTLCQLCKMAHEKDVKKKTYKLSEWFSSEKLCKLRKH